MREADRRGEPELRRAIDELRRMRRLWAEGRPGASPDWIAAAEWAILEAERAVRDAGGDPGTEPADAPSQPDGGEDGGSGAGTTPTAEG